MVAGQTQKPKLAPVIDLMEALKKSIADRGIAAAVPGAGRNGQEEGLKISSSRGRQARTRAQDWLGSAVIPRTGTMSKHSPIKLDLLFLVVKTNIGNDEESFFVKNKDTPLCRFAKTILWY